MSLYDGAKYPGILLRDGPAGQRAALAGGPDVWEVIAARHQRKWVCVKWSGARPPRAQRRSMGLGGPTACKRAWCGAGGPARGVAGAWWLNAVVERGPTW